MENNIITTQFSEVDLNTGDLIMLGCFNQSRENFSLTVVESSDLEYDFFIAGGENGNKAISSVEKYDPKINSWEFMSPVFVFLKNFG